MYLQGKEREALSMTVFYVFNEYGDFQFTTTDENYASVWCNNNNGVLMKIKKTPKRD